MLCVGASAVWPGRAEEALGFTNHTLQGRHQGKRCGNSVGRGRASVYARAEVGGSDRRIEASEHVTGMCLEVHGWQDVRLAHFVGSSTERQREVSGFFS
jgi:hypothetical protein